MLLNLASRPPRPPRDATRPTRGRSCASSPARATTTSPSLPLGARAGRGSSAGHWRAARAAPRRRSARCAGSCRSARCGAAGGSCAGSAALLAVGELRLRGSHTTSRTRWPPPPSAWRAGSIADAVRAGLRSFAGVAHRLEEVACRDGVLLRERLQGDEHREHAWSRWTPSTRRRAGAAIHLILGGQGKDQDFTALRGPVRAQLRGCVSDRRRRRGDRRSARRSRRWRCSDAASWSGPWPQRAAAAAQPGEVVLLVACLRELRPVRRLRSPRRALPRARRAIEASARPASK